MTVTDDAGICRNIANQRDTVCENIKVLLTLLLKPQYPIKSLAEYTQKNSLPCVLNCPKLCRQYKNTPM